VGEAEEKLLPSTSIQHLQSVQEAQQLPLDYTCESSNAHITWNDGNNLRSDSFCKTGIVQEDGALHFDRHNRLHKERPARVTSIMQALESSSLLGHCCTLRSRPNSNDKYVENDSNAAMHFLNDEDYLRVHLPGYMQRYVKLF
jgi:hypothetical protein